MRILRRAVDGGTTLLGKLKRSRRVAIPSSYDTVKVNIGCGLAVAPGWINIDGSFNAIVASLPRIFHKWAYRFTGASQFYTEGEYCKLLGENYFIHHDLSWGLPLPDGTVDFVYSSHFIEHLFRRDAERLLREAFRALKPGGMLRIAVPDLQYACSLYEAGEREKMLEDYFFVSGEDSYYARHKYMYDYSMLAAILEEAGFCEIARRSFRQGETPDIALLDNRPVDSLFVEARRK